MNNPQRSSIQMESSSKSRHRQKKLYKKKKCGKN